MRPGCSLTSAKVGLATWRSAGTSTPRATPCTNVVLPAPSGPTSASTSPTASARPSRSPIACRSAAVVAVRVSASGIAGQTSGDRSDLDLLEVDQISEGGEALANLTEVEALEAVEA